MYMIEMEEHTKLAYDLDDSEYKSLKSCVFGKFYLPKKLLASFFTN